MTLRIAALLLLLPALCAQAQYKWTDPNGQVSYGDQPPRDARQVERIEAAAGPAVAADDLATLPFEIRRAAQNFPVTLYAAVGPQCAPCTDARSFLKAHAIPFVEHSVSTSKDAAAFQALGGGTQLPALSVGRSFLRGFAPDTWAETLKNAGYPEGIALPSTWQWPAATPLTPPDAGPPATPKSGSNCIRPAALMSRPARAGACAAPVGSWAPADHQSSKPCP